MEIDGSMHIRVNGIDVHYRLDGPADAPVVTFSHSLASSLELWDGQAQLLRDRFRVLRYDNRGHGGTQVTPPPYSFDLFAEDAYELLRALDIDRTHFVGLSNGGMIGQTLALAHPEMVRSLVLCDTTSRPPADTLTLWEERHRTALTEGMSPLVEPTLMRWFDPETRTRRPDLVAKFAGLIRSTSPVSYAACCRAIQNFAVDDRIESIQVPTLLLVGSADVGTTVDEHRIIRDRIRGSELVVFPGAAHLSNLCAPEAFNARLSAFLDSH
jgi:3-oxoadipate enol-lactonase